MDYDIQMRECTENIVNIMTNEFPTGSGKKTYECVFLNLMVMITK